MKKNISLILLALFIFQSCEKDEPEITEPEIIINVEDFTTTITENPNNNQILGTIESSINVGELTFSITQQSPNNSFKINSSTGELKVLNKNNFDFETTPTIIGVVKVSNGNVFKLSNIRINLTDMEDTFTVTQYSSVNVQKIKNTPIFAHYMPWFESPQYAEFPNTQYGNWGQHWTMSNKNPENIDTNGKREIASHFYPLIGPYDNGEDDYLEYAVICMKLSGLDGVFIDYAGITEVYDWSLIHNHTLAIIPWLEKAGLKFSLVYEDASLKNAYNQSIITDKVTEGKRVMEYINANLFSKNNYFKYDGKPVLLNFGPQAIFTNDEWNIIFSNIQDINFFTLPYTKNNYNLTNSVSGEFVWVGETVNDDFYQYMNQFGITIGGAMPEFKDFYQEGGWGNGYTDYDNLNEQLLNQTLQRAVNTDIIQIITWNDFGEGTIIEPTLEFGYTRLEKIQEFLGVNYREQELSLAVQLYTKRKEHSNNTLINKKLDQVFYYLISLQIDNAQNLLNTI